MSGVTFKAKRERFCTVLHFKDGGCRPASDVELECLARIAELEAALRHIYGAVYDPEGMSDANTLDLVLSLSGDALGLPASAALSTKEDGT